MDRTAARDLLQTWWRRRDPPPPAVTWPPPFRLARAIGCLDRVAALLDATPWSQRARLDGEVRDSPRDTAERFPDWWGVGAADVAPFARASRRPVVAAGLLSMHPDGRVREAAVAVLAEVADGEALPLLLVRASDWVAPIRERARAAVDARLAEISPDVARRALPLVLHLAEPPSRGASWHGVVAERLTATLDRGTLVEGIGLADRAVRRACSALLVARGELDDDVLEAALAQDDVVVGRRIGLAALARRPLEVRNRVLTAPGSALRAAGLHHLLTDPDLAPETADGAARAALVDRSAWVRSLGQRHLARRGVDVAALYQALLPDEVRALHGLREVGRATTADLVRPYLSDPRPRARAAAVRAWCRLAADGGVDEAVALLGDGAPGVAGAARRALRGVRLPLATADRVWVRAAATNHPSVRRAALGVLSDQDRWTRLVVALRALGTDDAALREWGAAVVGALRDGWNTTATTPPPDRLAEARTRVADPATALAPADRADLAHLLHRWS